MDANKSTTWHNITSAAKYAGVTSPTVRMWMSDGMRHSRMGHRTVRIKQEWIDEYIENYEQTGVADTVNQMMRGAK